MNKKNILIVIAILVVTNVFTYYTFATNKVKLSGDTGNTEIASVEGKSYTADDIYTKWKESNSSTSALDTLLTEVDTDILEKKYGENPAIDEAVKLEIAQTDEYFKSQGSSLEQQFEKGVGITREDWEASLRKTEMQKLATVDYVKTLVTDEEIKDAHKNEVPQAQTSHILFKTAQKEGQTVDEADSAAKTKAEEVLVELNAEMAKANSEEDKAKVFADFAKKYSEDEESKDKGGDIGFSNSEDSAYQTAANELKIGEYTTTVIKTKYGYSIILKTGEKEKPSIEDETVQETYRTKLAEEKITAYAEYSQITMIKLREEAGFKVVDTDLQKKYEEKVEAAETSLENFNKNSEKTQ